MARGEIGVRTRRGGSGTHDEGPRAPSPMTGAADRLLRGSLARSLELLGAAGSVRVRYRLGIVAAEVDEVLRSIGRVRPSMRWECTGVLDYGARRVWLGARCCVEESAPGASGELRSVELGGESCGDELVCWVDDDELMLGPAGTPVAQAARPGAFWPNPLWWLDLLRDPASVRERDRDRLRVVSGRARLATGLRSRWRRRERPMDLDVRLSSQLGLRSVSGQHRVQHATLDLLDLAPVALRGTPWPTDTLLMPTGSRDGRGHRAASERD